MRRFLSHSFLSAAFVGIMVAGAPALRIAMIAFTTTQKTVQSEAVVVGKVTSIDADEVEAEPFVGAPKIKYKVVVIKLETAVAGVKGLTHIKVGFPATATAPAQLPGIDDGNLKRRPLPGGGIARTIALSEGQEGIFFLNKHATAAFYTIAEGFNPIDAKAPNYKDELAKVAQVVATISDPVKALKAEKAEDRIAATAILVSKYRTYPRNVTDGIDEKAIPAEVTRLIMNELIEADWTKDYADPNLHPQNVISQLGIFPGANGFPQFQPKPNDPNGGLTYRTWFRAELKKWYEKNGKFEIKAITAKEKK